jgi:hypothetical protein
MGKEPSFNGYALTIAAIALIVISLEVAYALSSTPAEISELSDKEDGGGGQVPDDYEPWTEPTILPPPGYLEYKRSHGFVTDYQMMAPGGTRIYQQNITVRDGTVNTTFEVDERWACLFIYVYVLGPIGNSTEPMHEEYWIASPTGPMGGSNGSVWGAGASGDGTYLYNDGPYGTWTFEYTLINGSAIILIEGYKDVPV